MALRLDSGTTDFAARFDALVEAGRGVDEEVDAQVAEIIAEVRVRGDAALIEYSAQFDRLT
ncbi:MAG: histidinol dehydrogenase, partial [Alphaproteobacteria bacterium]